MEKRKNDWSWEREYNAAAASGVDWAGALKGFFTVALTAVLSVVVILALLAVDAKLTEWAWNLAGLTEVFMESFGWDIHMTFQGALALSFVHQLFFGEISTSVYSQEILKVTGGETVASSVGRKVLRNWFFYRLGLLLTAWVLSTFLL